MNSIGMNMENQAFDGMRENLSSALRVAVETMIRRGVSNGTVTLKVGLEIDQEDGAGIMPDGTEVFFPKISHKVDVNVPIKTSLEGTPVIGYRLERRDGSMVLVNPQISMFEEEENDE